MEPQREQNDGTGQAFTQPARKLSDSIPHSPLHTPDGQAEQVGAMMHGLFLERSSFGYRRWFIPLALGVVGLVVGVAALLIAYYLVFR